MAAILDFGENGKKLLFQLFSASRPPRRLIFCEGESNVLCCSVMYSTVLSFSEVAVKTTSQYSAYSKTNGFFEFLLFTSSRQFWL